MIRSVLQTDKEQGGEKGRKQTLRRTTQQPALKVLLKVLLAEHQKFCEILKPPGWSQDGYRSGVGGLSRVSHGSSDYPAGPGAAVDLCVFRQVVAAGELLLAE